MPFSSHPVAQATTTRVTRFVPHATLTMGGVGAIIGGTAAAVGNIRRVRNGDIERDEAVKNTIKEAAGAGLATAAATVLVGAAGATRLLSLVGIVAVAAGTKYLWDASTVSGKLQEAQPEVVKPKPASKSKS